VAVRPPGHHVGRWGAALAARSQGSCLLNNVCIGAAYARVRHPWCQRIAVLDLDATHGNGTQDILQDDEESLFISVHATGPTTPFPGPSPESKDPPGVCNVALPAGFSSEQFREAMEQKVLPALQEFRPQLLLLSMGFSAHRLDALHLAQLSEDDFGWATSETLNAVGSSCACVSLLEGGYTANPESLDTAEAVEDVEAAEPTEAADLAEGGLPLTEGALPLTEGALLLALVEGEASVGKDPPHAYDKEDERHKVAEMFDNDSGLTLGTKRHVAALIQLS